jgi:hypothetical protein
MGLGSMGTYKRLRHDRSQGLVLNNALGIPNENTSGIPCIFQGLETFCMTQVPPTPLWQGAAASPGFQPLDSPESVVSGRNSEAV